MLQKLSQFRISSTIQKLYNNNSRLNKEYSKFKTVSMWYKQQTEFCIMLRSFKGIRIAYKGQYSLRFELVHQSDQGTRTSAYPYIYRDKQYYEARPKVNANAIKASIINRNSKRYEKTGKTVIQNNRGFYETPIFQVKYESHTQNFSELCLFKLEYKLKKQMQRGQTTLLISLLSHRKQLVEKTLDNTLQLKTRTQLLYTRKICLNPHLISKKNLNMGSQSSTLSPSDSFFGQKKFDTGLNNFIQVEMQDNDYFGSLYLYVGCMFYGWKIRSGKNGLCQFLSLEGEQKRKAIENKKTYILTSNDVGKCLRQLTRQSSPTILQYFQLTIQKSLCQLKTLVYNLYTLTQTTKSINSLNSFQSYPVYEATVSQFISSYSSIMNIQWSQEKRTNQICDYFQSSSINQLYFSVHYENQYLGAFARQIWIEFMKAVAALCIDDFVNICIKDKQAEDIVWKDGCIKFYNNHTRNLISHHLSQSKIILHEKNHRQSKNNPSKQSPSLHLEDIRQTSISNFQRWRKQTLQTRKIYYEQQFNHPLLMIENYSIIKKTQTSQKQKQRVQGLFADLIVGVNSRRKYGQTGLVVFVHGFKGSQYDLEKASEYLMMYNDQVDILRIRTIQNDIDYTIQQMATVVATQIKKYIMTSISKYGSISLVGYSLGGIIARACLPHLSSYRQKFNMLVTFSSPHLGTYATDNNLVKLGIWYMTKFSKCTILQQLHTCRDLKTSSKSYMKILSEQQEIGWFKKIVLVSCKEDQFVPHVSARIAIDSSTNRQFRMRNSQINGAKNGKTSSNIDEECLIQMEQMSYNIKKHAKRIERVEVWFDNRNKKGTLDKLTGRQSHIQFLDNCSFHKWFFQLYAQQL